MISKDSIPLVSLDSMNETHFEELDIVNMLLTQLSNEEEFEIISNSFEKLIQHIQEHFSTEERLMQEFRYPSYNMHRAEHTKVLNEARLSEMQWRNKKDRDALVEYLEENIAVWLDQHIKAMDTPMADFISALQK